MKAVLQPGIEACLVIFQVCITDAQYLETELSHPVVDLRGTIAQEPRQRSLTVGQALA